MGSNPTGVIFDCLALCFCRLNQQITLSSRERILALHFSTSPQPHRCVDHFVLRLAAGNLLTSRIYLSFIFDYAEGITSKIKIPPPGLEAGLLGWEPSILTS